MSDVSRDSIPSSWHIRLRRILMDYFSEEELQTLCFDLRVDYDDLEGNGKAKKAISLINRLARSGQIEQLIDLCSEARPNVPWADLRQAALQNPLVVDEWPDQEATVATTPAQERSIPSQHAGISLSPIVGAALALFLLGSIGLLVWVVRSSFQPLSESTPEAQVTTEETTETIAQTAVPSRNMLLSEDFENGQAPQWRDSSSARDQVVALPVIAQPDGNHVLRLKEGIEALYNPAWDWDTADYRLEADVMVIDLTEDTSIGFNVRVVSPNEAGYCQGYRAEIGPAYSAIHLITVPNNNCDDSEWQYDTLNNGSFALNVGEWHHLRLDVIGNQLRFFIDGVLTLVAKDSENTYPSGGVGLVVFHSDAVYVDNVMVATLSSDP